MLCSHVGVLFALLGSVLSFQKPFYDLKDAEQHFTDFMAKYDRHYENAEEYKRRFEIFKKKLMLINDFNENYEATFDVNQFADEELPRHINRTRLSRPTKLRQRIVKKEWIKKAPRSLDYRLQGLVTEVKDQKHCNSCYVFGAVGNIEGQYAKLTGELIPLSEQQALDCAGNPCSKGGYEIDVITALSQKYGLMREVDYPYRDAKGECRTDKKKVKVRVTSGDEYPLRDEEALKGALAKLGPLAIGLYASNTILSYSGHTVLKPGDCPNSEPPNHAVLLVGYSTDANGTPYWIIKNSWGPHWGEKGYLHLEMGKGHCAILMEGAVNANVARPKY